MYERFDNNGKVICQVCGKPFGTISPAHLKKHDMSMKQYIDKFPDFPLSSLPFHARKTKANNIELFSKIIKENEEIDKIREMPIEEIKDDIPEKKKESKVKQTPKVNKIGKDDIFYKLKKSYPNLQLNYSVRKKRNDGILLYQFITDMADPIQKIDFEFPETFWHNTEPMQDPNRDKKLKEDGWRILRFKGLKPDIKYIEKDLDVVSD